MVETLVALGLFSLLLGMLLSGVQSVRESAARAKCMDRMRQMGIALHSYEADHGRLPHSRWPIFKATVPPEYALSWMALILPQMGETALYAASVDACRADSNMMHNPPHIGFATTVAGYVCPDDTITTPMTDRWGRTVSFTSYLGVAGALTPGRNWYTAGTLGRWECKLTDITDGTSSTLLVGERPPPQSLQAGWWYPSFTAEGTGPVGPNIHMAFGVYGSAASDPACHSGEHNFVPGRQDNPCDRFHFWSLHPGGGNWLFADASVRFLMYSADSIMPALATRAGGEAVTVPD